MKQGDDDLRMIHGTRRVVRGRTGGIQPENAEGWFIRRCGIDAIWQAAAKRLFLYSVML